MTDSQIATLKIDITALAKALSDTFYKTLTSASAPSLERILKLCTELLLEEMVGKTLHHYVVQPFSGGIRVYLLVPIPGKENVNTYRETHFVVKTF